MIRLFNDVVATDNKLLNYTFVINFYTITV